MASGKTLEAEKMVKEAESKTKTGFFKTPDFDLAASLYTKAATIYKNGKEPLKCLECHLKAAESHTKNKIPFQAAKSLEQAAFAARDAGDLRKTVELINQACALYYENGVHDTAGTVLDRGAKMVEDQLPEQASAMYRKAADLALLNDKHSQASEMLDRAARLLVKMEKYDDASVLLKDLIQNELQNPTPCGRRYVLYSVLLNLKRDDYVEAKIACEHGERIPDYAGSGELQIAVNILDHFDRGDRVSLKTASNSPFIRSLDPAYALLARSLDVPQGDFATYEAAATVPASAAVSTNVGEPRQTSRDHPSPPLPSSTSANVAENDDDADLT